PRTAGLLYSTVRSVSPTCCDSLARGQRGGITTSAAALVVISAAAAAETKQSRGKGRIGFGRQSTSDPCDIFVPVSSQRGSPDAAHENHLAPGRLPPVAQ